MASFYDVFIIKKYLLVRLISGTFYCVLFISILLLSQFSLGGTMSPQEAISIMDSLEKKFQILKWRANFRNASLPNPENTSSFEVKKDFYWLSEVTFDPIGGRYFIHISCTSPWIKGTAPFVSYIHEQSFNGEIYRELQWEKAGKTLPTPQDTPGVGTITNDKGYLSEPGTSIVEKYAFNIGLAYMPPYFYAVGTPYSAQRFSRLMQTWLNERKDLTIVEDGIGVWIIKVKVNMGGYDSMLHINYDLTKGGVVTGIRELGTDEKGDFKHENSRVEIELQEANKGFWVPKTVKVVWPLDKQMEIISYDAVEVNPPVNDDTFRLDFPKGVYVTDYINNMYYVTGSATDRQSAIREFMRRHHLTSNLGETLDLHRSKSSFIKYIFRIFLGGSVLILLAILIFRFRKRIAL